MCAIVEYSASPKPHDQYRFSLLQYRLGLQLQLLCVWLCKVGFWAALCVGRYLNCTNASISCCSCCSKLLCGTSAPSAGHAARAHRAPSSCDTWHNKHSFSGQVHEMSGTLSSQQGPGAAHAGHTLGVCRALADAELELL
jgi:hypothetical protein